MFPQVLGVDLCALSNIFCVHVCVCMMYVVRVYTVYVVDHTGHLHSISCSSFTYLASHFRDSQFILSWALLVDLFFLASWHCLAASCSVSALNTCTHTHAFVRIVRLPSACVLGSSCCTRVYKASDACTPSHCTHVMHVCACM